MNLRVKYLIYFCWIAIILIGPVTVLSNTSLTETVKDQVLLINFFQRTTGTAAFGLLFCQIILGSYINFWLKYLGSGTLKLHIIEGLVGYGLFFIHPLLYSLFNLATISKLTIFIFPYLNINQPKYELYLSYGRIGFALLTIGVCAALLRRRPFMRAHWRNFHILNYFAFFFLSLHAWFLGSDVKSFPFSIFFWLEVIVITITIYRRFFSWRLKSP